ncbi:MAG: hypothetical protein JWR52_3683 [Marmoricola sp.]|nr:hypothetical protein [Marmoricola sp.]
MVVLVGLFAAIGFAPSAQAYPEVLINLSVNKQVLYSGQTFTATATANVVCDWTLEWNGDSRNRTGHNDFVTTYTAPDVTKVTPIPLHGTCGYTLPDGATPVTGRVAAGAAPHVTWRRTIIVTVLPSATVSPPTQGGLPNTGGPDLWILLGGLGLVAGGSLVIARSKRRDPAA